MSRGADNDTWFLPRGTARTDDFEVAVEERSDWTHTRLLIADLEPGELRELDCAAVEYVVIPLSGSVIVTATDASGERHEAILAGRRDVFAGPTDVAYVPAGSQLSIRPAAGASRVALAGAVAHGEARHTFRHLSADEVPVELRGAGIASREVRNFGIPGVLGAEAVIACEVITPAGNWSSWPPHKHDEQRGEEESELEEIYYFETRSTDPQGSDPVGYQRVYGTEERPIDVLAEVRTGDVVLVPHGWHGPAMAAPNADLYYLNVMAGPGAERAWRICDDPAHGWVRESWHTQQVDPRLPLGGEQ